MKVRKLDIYIYIYKCSSLFGLSLAFGTRFNLDDLWPSSNFRASRSTSTSRGPQELPKCRVIHDLSVMIFRWDIENPTFSGATLDGGLLDFAKTKRSCHGIIMTPSTGQSLNWNQYETLGDTQQERSVTNEMIISMRSCNTVLKARTTTQKGNARFTNRNGKFWHRQLAWRTAAHPFSRTF